MGSFGIWLFGEKDNQLVEEIAKLHKVDVEIVKKHYEVMLEAIKDEVEE